MNSACYMRDGAAPEQREPNAIAEVRVCGSVRVSPFRRRLNSARRRGVSEGGLLVVTGLQGNPSGRAELANHGRFGSGTLTF